MPHVIVEYSANLEPALDVPMLVRNVHDAVLDSGIFQIGAVRTRAERRDLCVVADGDPTNCFIHIEVRMASGRDGAARKRLAEAILATVATDTRDVYAQAGMGLSVEVREIDSTAAVRLNNLHERMAAKGISRRAIS